MQRLRGLLVTAAVFALVHATTAGAQQPGEPPDGNPWTQCCAVEPWPAVRVWPSATVGAGSSAAAIARSRPRQAQVLASGIPTPYDGLTNPLPRTRETVEQGGAIYAKNCAICHGASGNGDGLGGHDMFPPPGRFAVLAQLPAALLDPYIYWTVAEGGAPVGTGMFAFKDKLAGDDIWAVAAYLQARLPQGPAPAPPGG